MSEVVCPYCSRPALRMTGRELHPLRPDLADKHYHVCRNCDAWVGCRDGSWEPVGRLANAELRKAKQQAYAALEPIWKKAVADHGWTRSKARTYASIWLASEMGLRSSRANIGDLDLSQCELVMLICAHRHADLLSICARPLYGRPAQASGSPPPPPKVPHRPHRMRYRPS